MPRLHSGTLFDIAIVGGGASGVLTAIQLLDQSLRPLRIALIDRTAHLAEGIAYRTTGTHHLLNVPAGRMSAYPDRPEHFVDYLKSIDPVGSQDPGPDFVQRHRYADYLRQTLAISRLASSSRLQTVTDEVTALRANDDGVELQLASGQHLHAGWTVLAIGNQPQEMARLTAADVPPEAIVHGWQDEAAQAIPTHADILIAGSGLTMGDVLLTLAARGHQGRIHVASRHALMPLAHATHGQADIALDELSRKSLRNRIRHLRTQAAELQATGKPWQWLLDTLRPHVSTLWQTMDGADQRRFLRHARRYWDVHRHRVAPQIDRRLQAIIRADNVQQHTARVFRIERKQERLQVGLDHPRFGESTLIVDHVVNCLGLRTDIHASDDPLLRSLRQRGLIRPGPHGMGLDTDDHGALIGRDGQANSRLTTLGSTRIGQLWETIAIPDIREQAAALAGRLTSPAHLQN